MYTSIVLFALTGFTSFNKNTVDPAWLTDYSLALKQGMSDKKPVAVFIASGKDGWGKLVQGGSLGKEHNVLLSASYVCLYVDVATEEGKRLAGALEIGNGRGLVISDHTGQKMAFHHQGDLPARDLTQYLNRYADPQRVVRTTETNPNAPPRPAYAPPAPVRSAPVRSC
jgi:hypothetical protein